MTVTALFIALISSLLFTGLVLIKDRPRGAMIAQIGSVLAALLLFGGLIFDSARLSPLQISALGTGLLAATIGGMFYHLYLGRFEDVWWARIVFALIYLGIAAVFGTLYLALL